MLERYARQEMMDIWSLKARYQAWLEVEVAATNAWVTVGEVPAEDAKKIAENADFSVERIAEIEAVTRHDIVAFTRNVSEYLGPEKKWVHFGLTSTDVVDTANGVILKKANKILLDDLDRFIEILRKQALKYKDTVMMGRTHGVHAEPTTFGLKIARWYSEMKRQRERFVRVAEEVAVGKISGAVGTYANVPPQVEESMMKEIGLKPMDIASQVLPRDLYADYMSTLALIATSLETFATEVRSLQRSEIHEVEEFFNEGQKGSSAMPHKRNPIGSENISGLARVIRGYVQPALEDMPLWHERDISHSSVERIILPDATTLLDYMLNRFSNIVENLTVFPKTMKDNMSKTYGLIYSQRLLLKLVEKGLSREEAYDLVQPLTAMSWDEKKQFRPLVEATEAITKHLTAEDLDDAFDYNYHLRHVDDIFKKVGLS
ncbi:adenylosuccinate lyase [Holzapfeliella sp. He02]|uniref:Adenylosuccinate lyase n=1 Tax=Holzapfeliella saturejae TaxID=3082953 RepID=A0ABU8SH51_9LACO